MLTAGHVTSHNHAEPTGVASLFPRVTGWSGAHASSHPISCSLVALGAVRIPARFLPRITPAQEPSLSTSGAHAPPGSEAAAPQLPTQ